MIKSDLSHVSGAAGHDLTKEGANDVGFQPLAVENINGWLMVNRVLWKGISTVSG